MELVDSMNMFGEQLIRDDSSDLGYFDYRNRRRHKYHGRHAPDHPSPVHHYMLGTVIGLASYMLAPIAMYIDLRDEMDNELTG